MVDVSVTAANLRTTANVAKFYNNQTAGEALTRGEACYKKASDEKWWLADADASAEASGSTVRVGIAAQDVGAEQIVDIVYYDPTFTPGFTVVANTVYAVSATAGGIMPIADISAGDYGVFLMIGISTTQAFLDIRKSGVVTA